MEKGEVDAAFTSYGSLRAYHHDWFDQKKVHLLVQGTVARSSELPDVPAVGELGNSPDDRQMLQLYASTADIGRVLGSVGDRSAAVSVLGSTAASGGPLSLEPGDNLITVYSPAGMPSLEAGYFPRWWHERLS